jgi:hypothetical protein
VGVSKWSAFSDIVAAASSFNESNVDVDDQYFDIILRGAAKIVVGREEDVTTCALAVLSFLASVAKEFLLFETNACFILSAPDIIVSRRTETATETSGSRTITPKKEEIAEARRQAKTTWLSNFLMS